MKTENVVSNKYSCLYLDMCTTDKGNTDLTTHHHQDFHFTSPLSLSHVLKIQYP